MNATTFPSLSKGQLEELAHTAPSVRFEKVMALAAPFTRQHLDLQTLPESSQYLIAALVVIDQTELVLRCRDQLMDLAQQLMPVEEFYSDIGGLIGYQYMAYHLIHTSHEDEERFIDYLPPEGFDISCDSEMRRRAIFEAIKQMGRMAEIYPVGGAADRLQLYEKTTGENLPAARLQFLESNLLERLISDLEAREYLHYKHFGQQVVTPVAIMTSCVKSGDQHVAEICEQNNWFGRGKENFFLFSQPLVPTFDREGKWLLDASGLPLLKPGGHGVIWKLAEQKGVLDWLLEKGRDKALIRQINNPIAGTDGGLLAFIGRGLLHDKSFGFASCLRRIQAKEGMNVLRCRNSDEGTEVSLTNIEYCEFDQYGIEDVPQEEGSVYSRFPSNTNILFADIKDIKKQVAIEPYPGLIVNFKGGNEARLETMMQNIADSFKAHFDGEIDVNQLPTYLTFNTRRKTISVTKRAYTPGASPLETPVGCLYDFLQNARELLTNYCDVSVPPLKNMRHFLEGGPSFFFNYHPALGPRYTDIGAKIKNGTLAHGSELALKISDLLLEDFNLMGSLLIMTDAIMGHRDDEGRLIFSPRASRCRMKNITIQNHGLDLSDGEALFKNTIGRREALTVILGENSELVAEECDFRGNVQIEVKDNERVTIIENKITREEIR